MKKSNGTFYLLIKLILGIVVFLIMDYTFNPTPGFFKGSLVTAYCGYAILVIGDTIGASFNKKTKG